MMKRALSLAVTMVILVVCSVGCRNANRGAAIDERQIAGLTVKTFVNEQQNIEVIVVTGGQSPIVAVPIAPIARQNGLGPEETKCLAKCTDPDLEKRLNCILACPVGKYRVAIIR